MKRRVDDLPMVRASTLVALGDIRRDATTALLRFGDDGVEYQVGVRMMRFPGGGFWARFVCPRCDGGSQRLRLLDGQPACVKCARASGLIYRSQSIRTEKRHVVTAPPRIALICRDTPMRVNARPNRGGGKAGERRERASAQSDRCARVAGRQSEQGRDLTMASVATRIPDSVAHLDLTAVAEVLVKHGANVRNAAGELGVPTSDLRQLTLVNQALINAVYEAEELRLDRAESAVDEALRSDDSRRKDAAAYFILRNSSRAKRRGWITSSSTSVDLTINANLPPRQIVYRWRTSEDDKRDAEAAEADRLRDEGKPVVRIGWGDGGSDKTIEHEPNPRPSSED
jgi:hypothetical protein